MGCDIHCFREKKVGDVWVNQQPMEPGEDWNDELNDYIDGPLEAQKTYVSRNYDLFGLLSDGVRSSWNDAFKGKGIIPEDASPEIKAECDRRDKDGHSHSWLTLAEIKAKQMILMVSEAPHARELGQCLANFRETIFDETDDPENTRVIFWFDN